MAQTKHRDLALQSAGQISGSSNATLARAAIRAFPVIPVPAKGRRRK